MPEGDVAGPLSRVPALPPGYVVRDELAGLVDAVVGTAAGGAVGLTGEPEGVGLHGIGGIGKSVLAAALATDDRVRRRFPDGVFWVTAGERPDVLALQIDLLSRLGARPDARTSAEATAALRDALAGKRALLVVDDVWSVDAARAFRVTGPHGRLLYTSRDAGVVAAADATAHRVEVLSTDAARALAAEVLGVPAAPLPAAADRALAAVGHVPLAVALLAASVRGHQEWEPAAAGAEVWDGVAADLARDADVYGTHPYATTFRALNIAVAALPADLRAALLELAVFPPDTAVPVAAIARYWAHTRGCSAEETATDVDRLVAAEVMQRGATDAGTVGFHDLAHEYLLLNTDALPALHARLLDAYRGLLAAPDEWWSLPPDEPYVWEHLAAHLAGAGDQRALVATVTDPAYQALRIARDGPHAGEADLAVAARIVPEDQVVSWWWGWLARHAHLLGGRAGSAARPARVAATMLAWLEVNNPRPAETDGRCLTPLLSRPFLSTQGGLLADSSALLRVLTGHTGAVQAVVWSPDSTRLATAGSDNTVQIWDPSTGATLRQLVSHAGRVLAVSWSPDGTRLATTGDDAATRVWEPESGTILRKLPGHAGWVKPVAWSPDGRRLATAGTDGTARISDPTTGEVLVQLTGHSGEVHAVAWSPDGTRIATAGDDRLVRLWDSNTGERLAALEGHAGGVLAVAWSSDGTRLASTSTEGTGLTWNPHVGRLLVQLTGHSNSVLAASWSPDGAYLATASSDSTVRIWDSVTGQPLRQLTGHSGAVRAVGWSPDGTRLATTGHDGTARIWNPSTGDCKHNGSGTEEVVSAVS